RTRARNARRRSRREATRTAGPGGISSFAAMRPLSSLVSRLAAAEGFEPSSADSKPAVLPLDDAPMEGGRGVEPPQLALPASASSLGQPTRSLPRERTT